MPNHDRTMVVLFKEQPVADLRSVTEGNWELTYRESVVNSRDGGYLLSVSLPVRKETYSEAESRPFLDGLLPEGRLREQLCQRFRLDLSDVFGLLHEIGRDCAGAISFVPAEEPAAALEEASVEWLTEEEAAHVLEELPLRPLGADPPHGIRMSLAGGQSKLPVVVDPDGRLGLPRGRTPSTHILKPPSSERTGGGRPAYPGLVEIEAFCLRLAANCDLPVAHVTVRRVGGTRVLVVERYDRQRLATGEFIRVHQEDTCQALGLSPAQKYEEQGGPGIATVIDLLRRVSVDAGRDVLSFLERTAFNFGIANLDAHGKNIALLYRDGIRLAPMYDLICTAAFPRLSGRLAMSIGGQFQADQVTARHWISLLAQTNLDTLGARRRLADVGERIIAALTRTLQEARNEDFDHEVFGEIQNIVRQRAQTLLALRTYEARPKRPPSVTTTRRATAARRSIDVELSQRQFDGRVVLDVVNRGNADDFGAQLIAIEGAETAALLPLRLEWLQTDAEVARLLHGAIGVVLLGRHHRNGLNYLKQGKWNIEPPFVLREEPSPGGGGVEYVGIYPPPTISLESLEGYRFVLRVRVSSSSGYMDRAIKIGLSDQQPMEVVTEDSRTGPIHLRADHPDL